MKRLFSLIQKHGLLFGLIGVLNTITQHGLYLLMISLSIPYAMAQGFSFLFALLLSFVLNATFNYQIRLTLQAAWTFIKANLPSFLIQALALIGLVEGLGIPKQYALLLTLMITVPLSFLLITFGMLRHRS